MSRCHANYLLLLVLFGGLFVSASLAKTLHTDEVSHPEDRDTVTNGDGSGPRMIQHPRYKWTRSDHTIALLNHDRVVWQFNYGGSASKPNFHPLALLDGTDLSCQSTTNHTHHHALWFAWKMLNGVNYWEENPQTGLSDGLTELVNAKITPGKNHSARMDLTLTYHPPGAPPLLTEARTIIVSPPDKNGEYYIDWEGTFTAGKEEVVLKGGTAGGGYAGMSARISEHSHDWHLMDSEGREDGPSDLPPRTPMARELLGQTFPWLTMRRMTLEESLSSNTPLASAIRRNGIMPSICIPRRVPLDTSAPLLFGVSPIRWDLGKVSRCVIGFLYTQERVTKKS